MKIGYTIPKRALVFLPLLALFPFYIEAQGLHITAGAQWITNGAPNLVLNNASLFNNGNFEAGNGTVLFTGDAAGSNSFIGGERPIYFYHLTVSKSANDLQLNNDAGINGRITMSSGNLQLNNYTLDLGSSGTIIGESNRSCITGVHGGLIKITTVLEAPQAVNPGNIGVELTSQARLGSTVITRGHVQPSNSKGQSGIQRYFDIVPEMNNGLQATLRFFYLDGELAGKNKTDLTIFSSQEGHSDWSSRGKDQADASGNWVVKSNIGELHWFTLAIPVGGITSPIGEVTLQKGASLELYPNPSSGEFNTILVSDVEKDRVLHLYDQTGHPLATRVIHCQAGVNTIQWDISKYAAGVYYLTSEGLTGGSVKMVKY